MAYEIRDNSGGLFNNTRKETDAQPDRTGNARIGGVDYWVSGWLKTDRNGKQWLSLAFKVKADSPQKTAEPANFDDEIPF